MKKAYLLAAVAAAMMMTACGGGEENGSKNRTTTSTTKAQVSEESSSQAEDTVTTTAASQDSSGQETQTQQTVTDDSSQPDSSSQPEAQPVEIKTDGSRITAPDFGVDISYPDGWEVKGYDTEAGKASQTAAIASNEDLGVTSTVELICFKEGIKVSCGDYLEKLKQAYTELTAPDEGVPMSVGDVTIDEGSSGRAKTMLLSYTQRGVKCYIYTFVFDSGERENCFLQFSYAFSESDNTEHIKTALSDMMSK